MSVDELNKRMDKQDLILGEIRDKLIAHVSSYEEIKPALTELVSLWKGSKIMGAILGAAGAALAAIVGAVVWARDHIK